MRECGFKVYAAFTDPQTSSTDGTDGLRTSSHQHSRIGRSLFPEERNSKDKRNGYSSAWATLNPGTTAGLGPGGTERL